MSSHRQAPGSTEYMLGTMKFESLCAFNASEAQCCEAVRRTESHIQCEIVPYQVYTSCVRERERKYEKMNWELNKQCSTFLSVYTCCASIRKSHVYKTVLLSAQQGRSNESQLRLPCSVVFSPFSPTLPAHSAIVQRWFFSTLPMNSLMQ